MNLENKKQILIILAASLLGLIAAIGTGSVIQSKVNEQTKTLAAEYQKKNSVLINEMELVKKNMQQMVKEQNTLRAQQKALEQRPIPQVVEKEKTQTTDIVFSLKTPPGKRAMTVLIDSLSAVGGLVSPGDYVDIIAELQPTGTKDAKTADKITSVIMQNVQVLAVGTNFQAVGNSNVYQAQQKARSLNVTLALSPEETGLITFAQANGKLQLSLRSPSEQRTQALQVASWETLSDYVLEKQGTEITLQKDGKIEQVEEDEVKPFVEIYRGGREL
jgi:Flp pilus assembly protein CpaB